MTCGMAQYKYAIDPSFATKAIHTGAKPEQWTNNEIVPPIVLSTTFKQLGPGQDKGYDYGRSNNPSREMLEKCLAALEGGLFCSCFSSGLGATSSIVNALLNAGDHVICIKSVYGGNFRYFSEVAPRSGIEISFVDVSDMNILLDTFKSNTKLLWLENPTNPMMDVVDVPTISKVVKDRNEKIIIVVDNTFQTSFFQRPLELGADISVHSLTKYLNGHSDVVMGATITNNGTINSRIQFVQNACGAVPSPFDCFLVTRSLKTLQVRMREHMTNGLAVGKFLETHPMVIKVLHPGLPSHPDHALALRQWSGCSGMLSFYIRGSFEQSKVFFSSLKLFSLAISLGGYESLVDLPARMTHAAMPLDEQLAVGITDTLIRLSVGLENVNDLIEDLKQALNEAAVTLENKK
nr:PREDICTED: putative cystathionine gamma-lyase 2 isoform X1 [Bemisia tabaci]XP_018904038.1 PREDICTED: putative cystathionine gamma-lyase 2 isoform X1 [Bemisia tabaci]